MGTRRRRPRCASDAAGIWPEHRDIAAEALRELPAAQRKTIQDMWMGVRGIGGNQVCEKVVDPGAEPTDVPRGEWEKGCVDFASFPALAADHSCSAAELWADAAKEPWAVKVVWVAAKTKERLAGAKDEAQRVDMWSLSHLAMQYVDPRYLTRDEDDFLRTAVGVLRAVDAGVAYPVRGWQCRGCQFAHACRPKRPRLALVA